MSLQFVFGGSGAGKSTYVYQQMLEDAKREPDKQFFVMVPDQYTMSTQKQLCQMSDSGGIMNIDIQSFSRLTYRIAEEVGQKPKTLLDDTGKNLILRNISLQKEKELTILGKKLKRPGYVHEVKSMISEFYQYAISPDDMDEMIALAQGTMGTLAYKLKDLKVLYKGFQEYIADHFITSEESLLQLCQMIPNSELLKDADIVFDGFTGFTPIQCLVVYELLRRARRVTITLCADEKRDILRVGQEQQLFALSQQTYSKLCRFADREHIEILDNVFFSEKPVKRYEGEPELAFLEAELFRYHGKTYDKPVEKISIFEAQNPVSEVQNVCRLIKKYIREYGYGYRDIAIVTGDLNRYVHIMQREFLRYDIPYFMDQNRGVLYHPMTEYLKMALEIRKKNFSYESVIGFLRSGMSDISMDETDRLAMYLRRYGIRGKKAFMNPFYKGDEAREMEGIRQRLIEELRPVLGIMNTARDYILALYDLCVNAGLQKKCMAYAAQFEQQGDFSAAKEYEKIYAECMKLFDQMYQLLGEQLITRDEFQEIFEAGLSEIQIGTIPQGIDQVVVGDIERSRIGEIKVLFFIGVNDGVIPGKGSAGGLLSVMEREFFLQQGREMAPSPRQQIYQQRLYLYQNMTKPTKRLELSYTMMTGDGKPALPSYLIRVMQGLFPLLKIKNEETYRREGWISQIETWQDGLDDYACLMRGYVNHETVRGSDREKELLEALQVCTCAYEANEQSETLRQGALACYKPLQLREPLVDLLYEDKDRGSISRLETFAACGYAQFLKYGLGLKEEQEYDFTSLDLGNVYHDVLHHIFRDLMANKQELVELDETQVQEMLEDCLKRLEEEYGNEILKSSERNAYRVTQMKRVLMRSILTLQYQLAKGNFKPWGFEKSFTLPGRQKLIGKVDRVDLLHEGNTIYVKVVDYKSSHRSFDESEFYYGLSLQLPLYLHAMVEEMKKKYPGRDIVPASMLYFGLDNPIMKDDEVASAEDVTKEIYRSMRMEGLTVDEDVVLTNLDKDFQSESDVIKAKRKKDGSLTLASQTTSKEEMELNLTYARYKSEELMKEIKEGNIAINPVEIEGSQKNSCTFCPYRQVCRFDLRIPGFEMKELPKLKGEERKEAMQDAIDKGSKSGSDNAR